MSVGPHLKKFNLESNDDWRTQKCDFCVSACKTNFTDHHTPDTIHGFRDSVLICKMHDCYCSQKFRAFSFLPIKRWKQLQWYMKSNYFKMLLNILSTAYTYSNCMVYRLKNNLTNICSKITKTGINLWLVYTSNMKSCGKDLRKWEKAELLCIVDRNYERSVVVLDHFQNFKGL